MSAEPGSLSSWEIRGFSMSPWLACGSEQQLEESRGQASSSQDGGVGKEDCYVLPASRDVGWLLPPNPLSPLLPLLPCLRLYQPGLSSRRAPLPAVSISDLNHHSWVTHPIWRSMYVRRFAELRMHSVCLGGSIVLLPGPVTGLRWGCLRLLLCSPFSPSCSLAGISAHSLGPVFPWLGHAPQVLDTICFAHYPCSLSTCRVALGRAQIIPVRLEIWGRGVLYREMYSRAAGWGHQSRSSGLMREGSS